MATTYVDDATRAEAGFSRYLSFRLFQQYLRIADKRRERLNVADRRQAEWVTGLETFEARA